MRPVATAALAAAALCAMAQAPTYTNRDPATGARSAAKIYAAGRAERPVAPRPEPSALAGLAARQYVAPPTVDAFGPTVSVYDPGPGWPVSPQRLPRPSWERWQSPVIVYPFGQPLVGPFGPRARPAPPRGRGGK